ncbi:AAA family ATPase [Chitinimonas arctica]|uniref:AAA family ATPase n=1 Tax=Chitinimonas arctica TaxID=2594795 RepID=A0A516SFH7_9NEIS|nr:AAA family ATPase [Chitinimonas arctica]QDQ26916.1 AAA family ATPase [Chitinimonas arctica]
MRILAIRGKNLASLAGEFAVDFQQAPLAAAGLFTISGPTGAGKSTLLDALCLALYDATPRLLKASARGVDLPDVAGKTVAPHDTRTLLRRGAADGYAEVDFIGGDGLAYRARWSVRRAGGKAGGSLQAVAMSLNRLADGQPLGGTKSEVKAEIEQRLGLGFEQFTRAVLLAQNEFSAFLKADDSERGELLETLTGSTIYSEISKRAFARCKEEQAAWQRLNDRLADQAPMEAPRRAELVAAGQLADIELAELVQYKLTMDEQLRWHDRRQQLETDETRAQSAWQQLDGEYQAASPDRAELSRIEAVQPARPLLVEFDRSEAELAAGRQAITALEARLCVAEQGCQQADAALRDAELRRQAEEQARLAATPLLDQAKALDAQLAELAPVRQQAEQLAADTRRAETEARTTLHDKQRQIQLLRDKYAASLAWLAERQSNQALFDAWPRWDTLLGQAAQRSHSRDALRQAQTDALAEETRWRVTAEQAEAERLAAANTVAAAEVHKQQASAKLAEFDLTALAAQKQTLETQREQLNHATQAWQAWQSMLARQIQLTADAQQLRDSLAESNTRQQTLASQRPTLEAAQAQAERALKIAEAACSASVEALRAGLQDQQACPVCGALEHPYAHAQAPLQAMLAELQAEQANCRDRLAQLLQAMAGHAAQAEQARQQLQRNEEQAEPIRQACQSAESAWQALPLAAELQSDEDVGDQLAAQRRILQSQWQQSDEHEQLARGAALARDLAQAELEQASRQLHACQAKAADTTANWRKAESVRHQADDRLAECGRQLDTLLQALDEAFPARSWRDDWQTAPDDFHRQTRTAFEQWQAHCQARDQQAADLDRLGSASQALGTALTAHEAQAQRADSAWRASQARMAGLEDARRQLFDGQPVGTIEAAWRQADEAAKADWARQSELSRQAAAELTRGGEALKQAGQVLGQHLAAQSKADDGLRDWLARCDQGLDAGQLRMLLSHEPAWIATRRAAAQSQLLELEKTRSVLTERRQQSQAHEQTRPVATHEQLGAALTELLERQGTVADRAGELRLALAQDDERRRQSAALLAELAEQSERTRLWAQLQDLIGAADGKKFRNYAQQFTLDVLLGYANQHLRELARRYRLERIPDTLALMVIDQDMGAEIRSVHSLSGGESFLVSLALALGLASLSSNRVRVGSLFIDEGFGSLDADTLTVAMDALDGLQALGRKVGVISHVQEMTERIGTRIVVRRTSGGRSEVVVEGS